MRFSQTLSTISPLLSLSGLSGTFDFKGTGVWLEASSSSSPSVVPSFTVRLDADVRPVAEQNTASGSNVIFRETNLSNDVAHSIEVSPLSVARYIGWDMESDADMMVSIDNSELFSASSDDLAISGDWNSEACIPGVLSSGTCQVASSEWSLSYSFNGDAVTLWGALADEQTQYSVSVDNASPVVYRNQAKTQTPSTILAHFSNLGEGKHTFTVRSANSSPSRFALDKINVFAKEATYERLIVQSKAAVPHSARIGIIVGSVLGCLAIAAALMVYYLRRERKQREQASELPISRPSQDSIATAVEKKYADSMSSTVSSVKYKPSLFGQPMVSPTPVALPALSYRNDEEITTARGRTKMALLSRFGL